MKGMRIVAGTLAAACLLGLCSCDGTDFASVSKSGKKSEKKSENAEAFNTDADTEAAYISVFARLFGIKGDSLYEDREAACREQLKDWSDAPFDVTTAACFQTLYLNNEKFDYYYLESTSYPRYVMSGTVSKDQEGALAFSYQEIRSYRSEDATLEKIIHYPEETEQEYSRVNLMMYDRLKTGSETQTLYVVNAFNCAQDKHAYLRNAYLWDAQDQKFHMSSINRSFLSVLSKGDYLVAPQKGYTLSTETAGESFSLHFSDAELYENEENISYTITFDGDNTWVSDYRDGYSGKWELLDENLLYLYPPENVEDYTYTPKDASIFYLDFAEDTVYTPLFVKSETMLPVVQQMKLEDEVE